MSGWTGYDGDELKRLTTAVCEIRDVLVAREWADHDEPATPEPTAGCPACGHTNTFDMRQFGTPPNVDERACGECRAEWTVVRPVEVGESRPATTTDTPYTVGAPTRDPRTDTTC